MSNSPLSIGISACLLGHEVRYDGAHKLQGWLSDPAFTAVNWLPVCPEVELGLGVPRPTIDLWDPLASTGGRSEQADLRLSANDDARDLTEAMRTLAESRIDELLDAGLCGYVFKARSPSCGLRGVKVFGRADHQGPVERRGRGMFAAALLARRPALPVAEEHELDVPGACAAFVARAAEYRARSA
ncbi:DUF523 domain-containing protein [Haliangium sp.]|uniref:DUF523 domain-containing protein n=1 Tax=Haliangium sp. TaxID=2663208 RepID=UPI003D0EABFF